MKLEHEIEHKVHESMDENQRDYYLREQMKVISEELGEDEDPEEEAEQYRKKIAALSANDEIKERLNKEVNRLLKMPSGSHEATVVRGYLDTCLELPFGIKTKEKHDINAARKQLDRDHFGLEKVKERIVEFLAVKAATDNINAPILCLVGPPGVGKTSIVVKMVHDILNETCPKEFKGFTVLALDVISSVAGTMYRGQAEERFSALVDYLNNQPNIILFIDEMHLINGAGACREGEIDLANTLKPILAGGKVRVIGATTRDEYETSIPASLCERTQNERGLFNA